MSWGVNQHVQITCFPSLFLLFCFITKRVSVPEREREMALRAAILRHVRVPIQTLTLTGPKRQVRGPNGGSLRFLSSHGDDHMTKDDVIDRVLSVVKSFPKVDPSKVCSDSHFLFHFPEKMPVWFLRKYD
jgi:hypothetical protein